MALISSVKRMVSGLPRRWDFGVGREPRVLHPSSPMSAAAFMSSNRSGDNDIDIHTPENYKSRMVQFSGDRSRDFMGQAFDANHEVPYRGTTETTGTSSAGGSADENLDSYDCHGTVNLNAVMQSTVPEPFTTDGKKAPTHYNMPGGHVRQSQKYLSDDLQNAHYQSTKRDFSTLSRNHWSPCREGTLLAALHPIVSRKRSSVDDGQAAKPTMTSREKLKRAIKDYGSTVIVFHVGISLVSLGACYLVVSSGVDVESFLGRFMDNSSGLAAGVGTFALAYAVHKIFAPVRIGITLTAVPFVVRYLRSIGFLKAPKKN